MEQLLAKMTPTMATSCYFELDVSLFLETAQTEILIGSYQDTLHTTRTYLISGIRAEMTEQCNLLVNSYEMV